MTTDAGRIASIRQRLLNLSRKNGEEFQFVLVRYALERLLYRLSESPYRDRFVLKGGLLLLVWENEKYRPTRDLDLLAFGEDSAEEMTRVFREICDGEGFDDGLRFDLNTLSVQDIREEEEYQGKRLKLIAYLGVAQITLQIDIGFGDVVTPEADEAEYPSMLDLPTPHLRVYNRETVIAEKFQAMVILGITNGRMKDFFDIWTLQQRHLFDGCVLWKRFGAPSNEGERTFRRSPLWR